MYYLELEYTLPSEDENFNKLTKPQKVKLSAKNEKIMQTSKHCQENKIASRANLLLSLKLQKENDTYSFIASSRGIEFENLEKGRCLLSFTDNINKDQGTYHRRESRLIRRNIVKQVRQLRDTQYRNYPGKSTR